MTLPESVAVGMPWAKAGPATSEADDERDGEERRNPARPAPQGRATNEGEIDWTHGLLLW